MPLREKVSGQLPVHKTAMIPHGLLLDAVDGSPEILAGRFSGTYSGTKGFCAVCSLFVLRKSHDYAENSTGLPNKNKRKYEGTMDLKLLRIQRSNDVTRARRASGQPVLLYASGRWMHYVLIWQLQRLTLLHIHIRSWQSCRHLQILDAQIVRNNIITPKISFLL